MKLAMCFFWVRGATDSDKRGERGCVCPHIFMPDITKEKKEERGMKNEEEDANNKQQHLFDLIPYGEEGTHIFSTTCHHHHHRPTSTDRKKTACSFLLPKGFLFPRLQSCNPCSPQTHTDKNEEQKEEQQQCEVKGHGGEKVTKKQSQQTLKTPNTNTHTHACRLLYQNCLVFLSFFCLLFFCFLCSC